MPYHFNTLKSPALWFWIAALTACVLSGASSQPAGDLLKKAALALADGLDDVAEQSIRQYIELTGQTNQPPAETVILLARTMHGQKHYREMLKLLNQSRTNILDESVSDQFTYWLALACYENGLNEKVLEETSGFDKKYPRSAVGADVIRLRVKALLKTGHEAEAGNALQELIRKKENKEALANDRLALAQIYANTGKTREAGILLEQLAENPPSTILGQKTFIALGRIYMNDKQFIKARPIYETLSRQKNIPAEYRLQAVAALADIAIARSNYVEAFTLLEKGGAEAQDMAQKNEITLRKGILLLKMNKTDDGIAAIHNYVNAQTNAALAAEVQMDLAQSLFENGLHEKALTEFQNYIETFSSRTNVAAAYRGKGVCLFSLGRFHEAAAAFNKAADSLGDPEEKNECSYRAADSFFAAGQYKKASEIYTQISAVAGSEQLSLMAMFQTAECLLQINNTTEAETLLWKIYDHDPAGILAPRALLRLADIFLQKNRLSNAETVYRWVEEDYADQWHARALYGLGMITYQQGHYPEALKFFEQTMKSAGEKEVAATAAYMSAWSLYMMKKPDEARRRLVLISNSYAASSKAPEALFHLGELDYNSARYDSAETSFRLLADKYPQAAKADAALFWAGRTAMNQNEFRRARDYFSALIKRYPASPRKLDARYYQGAALCELGQFDAAILIFSEIIKQNPEHPLAESAAFKKADCQFTLGSDEAKRYEEAINSYQYILDQPGCRPASRLQARYKIGRCLEKLGKANEAFSQYFQVIALYLQSDEPDSSSDLWFSRAAFNAAAIMEEKQAWQKAANIYERVVEADIPASHDAQERIDKLRAEHWLSFY
jgi:TolA-binding protein